MPRKKLVRHTQLPYHVVNRTIDQKPFPLSSERLWPVFCENALLISWAWGARIHALVLMGNHYHMILSTPDGNLDSCMQDFQSEIAQSISNSLGTGGYRFQARYKWSLVEEARYMNTLLKYVYQNPLKANICKLAEEYPYSTLHGIFGNSRLKFPIYSHPFSQKIYDSPNEALLNWINQPFAEFMSQKVQDGIHRSKFSISISKSSKVRREEIDDQMICPLDDL